MHLKNAAQAAKIGLYSCRLLPFPSTVPYKNPYDSGNHSSRIAPNKGSEVWMDLMQLRQASFSALAGLPG